MSDPARPAVPQALFEVIVSGQPITLALSPSALVRDVIEPALVQTNTVSSPEMEWEVRLTDGSLLLLDQPLSPFQGQKLWVNLRAGFAAAVPREPHMEEIRAQLENGDVPLKRAEIEELARRLADTQDPNDRHTRFWSVLAIGQLLGEVDRLSAAASRWEARAQALQDNVDGLHRLLATEEARALAAEQREKETCLFRLPVRKARCAVLFPDDQMHWCSACLMEVHDPQRFARAHFVIDVIKSFPQDGSAPAPDESDGKGTKDDQSRVGPSVPCVDGLDLPRTEHEPSPSLPSGRNE